jgi:molybdopterin converting factor small subunit
MAEVTLLLPKMLEDAVGRSRIPLRATTLRKALEEACRREPALEFHLFERPGRFREHVLCFLNETSHRDMKSLDAPLRDGDEITIMQAISGG